MSEALVQNNETHDIPAEVGPESEHYEMLERVKRSTVTVGIFGKHVNAFDGTESEQLISHASGFFLRNGMIMTSAHVAKYILGGARFAIRTSDGQIMDADVAYIDPVHDVAILRPNLGANAVAPQALELADPQSLRNGQKIWAVGTPFNPIFGNRVEPGVINKVPEAPRAGDDGNTALVRSSIESTANTKPGMSGGPIVNEHGQVVGIVTAGVPAPGRPEAGTHRIDVGVASFEMQAQHPELFVALFEMANFIGILKDHNSLPEQIAGRGVVGTAILVLGSFDRIVAEYCSSMGVTNVEAQTLFKAQLLANESVVALLKAGIARTLFREEMVDINSYTQRTRGFELYTTHELEGAQSLAALNPEPAREQVAA